MKVVDNEIILNSGFKMPLLGLGCWQSAPEAVENAVETALDHGYCHIDTAYAYKNEKEVGNGIHKWLNKTGNKREDIFVVTKLPAIGMRSEGVEKFLKLSLEKLNLEYVDLYLVHSPFGVKNAKNDDDLYPLDQNGKIFVDFSTDLIAIWKEMEKMVEKGLAKSIGVSNFSIKQTRKIIAISKIPPAVNQVEAHVYFQQRDLHDFLTENNIVMTAYSPLGSPGRPKMMISGDCQATKLLENPVVKLIADKHHVTTAQVLIRYWIEKNVVVIPKSVNPERIKTNGDVFSFNLDETDKAALLLLDKGNQGRSFNINNFPGLSEHPEVRD